MTTNTPTESKLLTPQEVKVINDLAITWNDFLSLEQLHPDDTVDFKKAIHQAQRIVMSRPVKRELGQPFKV